MILNQAFDKKETLFSNNLKVCDNTKPGIITGKRKFILSQAKYLNNIVEQDHRHIKRITRPMGCFRKMYTAARTIAGIELMNMIKKRQLHQTQRSKPYTSSAILQLGNRLRPHASWRNAKGLCPRS